MCAQFLTNPIPIMQHPQRKVMVDRVIRGPIHLMTAVCGSTGNQHCPLYESYHSVFTYHGRLKSDVSCEKHKGDDIVMHVPLKLQLLGHANGEHILERS